VAVLIPTGGTTGLPKIVPQTHNSLISVNSLLSKYRRVSSKDVFLQATPVGHAMAMYGAVNTSVFNGSTLVFQGVLRPTEILETIQREKITIVSLVPTQLEGMLNHPDLDKYDVSSLRFISTAGASLPIDIARKAVEYFSRFGCEFAGNALGASEGLCTHGDLNDPLEMKLEKVGRNIIPGSHYKVIDEELNDLPVDTVGELVVKGPEIFTGYYNANETEIKETFTPDGYFRTGDLVNIDQRGYITVTGRKKDVIIRGGETLVPGEMERLIREHPDVADVAVVGMPDPKMGERACAFVVAGKDNILSFEEMIDFLKSKGAGMLLLPERLEIIDKLPVTGIGKVDKNELRKSITERLSGG
jgi:non-ribosomal peptide synthetase component E (peptide arylation enzyme)